MGQSFSSKILTLGKVDQTWEQRRGKLRFCLGLSLGCGRGIHFQGGGGSTKCIVVPLVTSHLFLIKEAAEPNLSALEFLGSAGGSGTSQGPGLAGAPSQRAAGPLKESCWGASPGGSLEYFPWARFSSQGRIGSFPLTSPILG